MHPMKAAVPLSRRSLPLPQHRSSWKTCCSSTQRVVTMQGRHHGTTTVGSEAAEASVTGDWKVASRGRRPIWILR